MLDGLQDGTIDINEAKVFLRRHCKYLRNCCFQFQTLDSFLVGVKLATQMLSTVNLGVKHL
jgi:hypothetical protein